MTRAWKLRVHAKLKENEGSGAKPASVPELARMLRGGRKADKAGLYRALDPEGGQTSSGDVEEICRILGLPLPLVETETDADLERDLDIVRALKPEARQTLMEVARHLPRK